ncbi:hypothetical protein [Flavobacterium suncheonense]|uniref:Uncharacterized protein n=1 Tax=Flavobacterium suncheonense GH29-5 = DSM 17707 TaxID=1121899 RepID=A0A0A2MCH4_9FLAO|nr:hypothetical protein [Flavobacterium suncheonense]KGO89321.1 hypothetical protein Q764_08040 [Flavobacterium suncheonense GH29-5 = DSM 17707]
MKNYFLLFALLIGSTVFSQNVSDYKYVVIPQKFSFSKKPNQYRLNSLTKSVFEQQGFTVFYDDDVFPQELAENRCKALYADMLENNTLFFTKIKLELKDCRNQVVFVSEEGTSREKEFDKAYIQAFRVVGKSIQTLKSKPKEEVKTLEKVVVKEQMDENTPVSAPISTQLFAQPTTNGFQLVDSSPKVVLKLFKTSVSNFYIGQKDVIQGVVFNKNNQWLFEYYLNGQLVSEKLEIKF